LCPSELVPLDRLHEERHSRILCYPRFTKRELKKRLRELKKIGVEAIEFTGEKMAFDVPVLGKGCVGIVVIAQTAKGKAALKIRRVDADRAGMQREAEMLKRANAVQVGPSLLDVMDDFLLMEFIEGMLLPQWVMTLKGRGTKSRIRQVLREVLEQCWRLDTTGLDHGELSHAPKHIIIDKNDNSHILDFETASISRRVSNVTSICKYLFIRSQAAKMIKRKLGEIVEEELLKALKNYKQKCRRENFEKILAPVLLCR